MCSLHDLLGKVVYDHLIKEINDSQYLKDEATFAFFT